MAASPAPCATAATSAGATSPSDAVEWQWRSTRAVCALRRRPRGLRLVEQLHQLLLAQLGEGRVGTAVADGRETRVAALAVGPGAQLEHDAELIPVVNRHASRGRHLPALAVDRDRAAGHQASAPAASGTSLHSSHASGAYVPSCLSFFSSWISSGNRDAWARWLISVGLSENSMNRRGSLAWRNSQMRWPRASANCCSSRNTAR